MSRNRILLTVCGTQCAITSEDDEGYIRSIGVEVDKAMNAILEKNDRVSITMAAVMTALNYCDAAHKSSGGADNLRSQIKDYLEDSTRARTEAEESKREVERLKHELQTLRQRLEEQSRPAEPKEEKPVETAPAAVNSSAPVKSEELDQEEFMSFFEKKDDEL